MMASEEKTRLLKDLAEQIRNAHDIHLRDRIPGPLQEEVKTMFVEAAEKLRKNGLEIPECRRVLHELLDVSV